MEELSCSKCKETKPVSEFWKSRTEKRGRDYFCIPCRKEHWRAEYARNPDRFKRCAQNYGRRNAEAIKARRKIHYEKNRERLVATSKAYQKTCDQVKLLAYRRERYKQRMATDPLFRLRYALRGRFREALNKFTATKRRSVIELCGCSIEFLREYLERQFKPGMTWHNHGISGWHIDHRKPCAKFNLLDFEEQRRCFHFSNLQPLWAQENLSKAARV